MVLYTLVMVFCHVLQGHETCRRDVVEYLIYQDCAAMRDEVRRQGGRAYCVPQSYYEGESR